MLKALLNKGHIEVGIDARLQITRSYLASQEQEYVFMKTKIEAMRAELARQDEQT